MTEAGDTEWPGAAVIYSVIEQIVRETESFCEPSDCIVLSDVGERAAGVCI